MSAILSYATENNNALRLFLMNNNLMLDNNIIIIIRRSVSFVSIHMRRDNDARDDWEHLQLIVTSRAVTDQVCHFTKIINDRNKFQAFERFIKEERDWRTFTISIHITLYFGIYILFFVVIAVDVLSLSPNVGWARAYLNSQQKLAVSSSYVTFFVYEKLKQR